MSHNSTLTQSELNARHLRFLRAYQEGQTPSEVAFDRTQVTSVNELLQVLFYVYSQVDKQIGWPSILILEAMSTDKTEYAPPLLAAGSNRRVRQRKPRERKLGYLPASKKSNHHKKRDRK